jgi:hypothetical protein
MTRLDWIVLRRVAARVGITFAVFFGIAALAVSLDLGRFGELSRIGGPLLGISGIVTSALRTSVSVLPIVVLIGTIIGVLDLQARREMTIIKSSLDLAGGACPALRGNRPGAVRRPHRPDGGARRRSLYRRGPEPWRRHLA